MPQSFRRLQGPHRGLSRPLHRSVVNPLWTEITDVITFEAIDRFWSPRHTWHSVAFLSATASGVLARVPAERIGMLSYFCSFMPALERAYEREFHDGAELRAISRSGSGLTENEQARVADAVR